MGSIRKSLKRYHCWCVTPCRTETHVFTGGGFAPTEPLTLSHLFSLMVRLSHFDVCDQVPTRARVLDVGHGDHQVVEGGALRLFGLAQLFVEVRAHVNEVRRPKTEVRILRNAPQLTSSPSGQLLISRP